MSSKWCPKCGRINSVYRSIPKFCMWGCGSLRDEPLLSEAIMNKGYYQAIEYARKIYSERQKLLSKLNTTKAVVQLKLF